MGSSTTRCWIQSQKTSNRVLLEINLIDKLKKTRNIWEGRELKKCDTETIRSSRIGVDSRTTFGSGTFIGGGNADDETQVSTKTLCVLDRALSWYLNKGWPTRWHLLHYLLLNMFQTLIRPSSGASDYLLRCVGWLEACWCYVARLSVGDVVSECRLTCCVV